jgi:hypothetical protein
MPLASADSAVESADSLRPPKVILTVSQKPSFTSEARVRDEPRGF